ncbi:MAG: hypothetical protein ACR2N9_01540, partial [Acidimicrobiia bacterium]
MNSEAPPNVVRPDVLYWDPQDIGHHRRYLDAVLARAPEGYHVLVPAWYRSVPPPQVTVTPIEQATSGEYDELRAAIDQHRPLTVVLGLGHKVSRRLA